jgi:alpha-glucosidase
MCRRGLWVAALFGLWCRVLGAEPAPVPRPVVRAVPDDLRARLKLDPFYEKSTDYKGLPILSSGKVSDAGLAEARYLIGRMLAGRDDVTAAMVKAGCRFVVMAPTEMTTDVPEQRNMTPKDYWDKRARGLGGRITSCGEENLLNLKGDRYGRENILIHEFAHCIHQYGLRAVDPKFDARLRAAYARTTDAGLWKDTYAATNHSEYWAEGVQSYFDCNNPPNKGVHNDVDTREELAKYDPELFALIDEAFRKSDYRYVRYDKRK